MTPVVILVDGFISLQMKAALSIMNDMIGIYVAPMSIIIYVDWFCHKTSANKEVRKLESSVCKARLG